VDAAAARDRIEELVEEEHRLWRESVDGGLDEAGHERVDAVRRELDRCWDVLRRRRAGQGRDLPDRDVPDPPNELDGPDPEPPHLERGSGRGDEPSPDPDVNPNVP
jgi:Protein of unknown function (DUF2630)